MDEPQTYLGVPLVENANLMVPGEPEDVKRSLKERFLSRPWRPWRRYKKVRPMIPDPEVYVLDQSQSLLPTGQGGRKMIVGHPETIHILKRQMREDL